MNKHETSWLIVRLIGIYFAYLAVASVFTLAASISIFYSLNADSRPEADISRSAPAGIPGRIDNESKPSVRIDPLSEKAKGEAFRSLLLCVLLTGLYGGIACYLIFKGSLLFNILNREDTERRSRESAVTTIKL